MKRGWYYKEPVEIAILNPRPVVKVEGPPEDLEKLYLALLELHEAEEEDE